MSKKTTKSANGAETVLPTADAVTAFLRANPDFLAQNPELLASMKAPGAAREGNVFDLQHFKVQRLQSEKERLVSSQRHLIDTARANQSATSQVHTAALAVINAPTFEAMIQAVTTDWAVFLDIDAVTLCVEDNGTVIPPAYAANIRGLGGRRVGRTLLPDGTDIRLDEGVVGDPRVFGAAASLVRSQALARLNISAPRRGLAWPWARGGPTGSTGPGDRGFDLFGACAGGLYPAMATSAQLTQGPAGAMALPVADDAGRSRRLAGVVGQRKTRRAADLRQLSTRFVRLFAVRRRAPRRSPGFGRFGGLADHRFQGLLSAARARRPGGPLGCPRLSVVRGFFTFLEQRGLACNTAIHHLRAPKTVPALPRPEQWTRREVIGQAGDTAAVRVGRGP